MKHQHPINFTKMHGLGNDFMVVDTLSQSIKVEDIAIPQLSSRYTGIGFDQLLWIDRSTIADFSCRFFNSDGSEAEQCGNGIRCVGRYLHENHFIDKKEFTIETKAGIVNILIHDYTHIDATLGIPHFKENKKITLGDQAKAYEFSIVSMGNPHAILVVDAIETFPVQQVGQQMATHPNFTDGINVGFMQIINPHHILLRTFERGVGETFACGSNACAAAVAGIKNKQLENPVVIELLFGKLAVQWAGEGHAVILSGPAERVFTGCLSSLSS